MDYNKIEQQEKPETKQPTDKNDGAVAAARPDGPVKVPENVTYEDPEEKVDEPKKSLLARFIDLFVGSNGVKQAAKRVLDETVFPSLTSLGVDFLENTLETMVYGTPNRANYSGRQHNLQQRGNQTPYNAMFSSNQLTSSFRPAGGTRGKIRKLPEPAYPTSIEADEFIDIMSDYIRDNGYVTVYQYLNTANWPNETQATDRNWGWHTSHAFSKRRVYVNGEKMWAVTIDREPESL